MKRLMAVAGLLLCTAACVGVPSSGRKIRVACIGDSITWGYAMTNRVAECYPAQLQRLLGDQYEVRNFGVPGSGVYSEPCRNSSGWKAGVWRTSKTAEEAYAYKPDIVVSNLGINNSDYMNEFIHHEDGRPVKETGSFYKEYVDLLRAFSNAQSTRFVIWTRLAPLGKGHRYKGNPYPFVMERDLARVADAVGSERLDMYAPLVPYCETSHFAADGVHPEGGAQRVIAEITAKQILNGENKNE